MIFSDKKIEGFGLGLRFPHFDDILQKKHTVPWFEVITDDFIEDGPHHKKLLVASTLVIGVSSCSMSPKTANVKEMVKSEMMIKGKKASTVPATVSNPIPGEVIVKCAGIVKKGMNHCGANGHTCGGKAVKDFDQNEWIYVREDVCNATAGRIVGKKRVTKG